MERKKKIIKKIVMSRRILVTSKLTEETKLCSAVLFDLQKKHLHLLKQLHIPHTLKISLSSKRLSLTNVQTQTFWETDYQHADESLFKNNFRMSRNLFYKLCKLLTGLRRKSINMAEAIPLEKMVAIALYALGSSEENRSIANKLGVGETTVHEILLNFCNEVWKVLAPTYLKNFPLTKKKIEDLVQEFEVLGFPQCMGALDVCHIKIHPPNENSTDYFNTKGWYSITLLALVDARCRFIYASCGRPGRNNDFQIFQGSSLKQHLDKCNLLTDLKKNISGVDVPVFITGDSEFRLTDKLMKPYSFQVLQSHQQKRFNSAWLKSHKLAKKTFNQLKARFKHIKKCFDSNVRNANTIVLSSCALHNFLNENNDIVNDTWLQDLQSAKTNGSYPKHSILQTDQSNNPERIRNAISTYLSDDETTGGGEFTDVQSEFSGEDTIMDTNINGDSVDEYMIDDNDWY